jgi:hypothetical protein
MVRTAIGLSVAAAILLVAAIITRYIPLVIGAIILSFSASAILRVHLFRRRRPS